MDEYLVTSVDAPGLPIDRSYHALDRYILSAALSLLLLLTACAPASTASPPPLSKTLPSAAPQWTPIAPPPTPPVVSDFVEGLNEMPPGKYLFVEYWTDYRGISTSGQCPGAAMIDFPTYGYSEGSLDASSLDMSRGIVDVASPPIGFFGYGTSHSGAMGGGADSELYVVDKLPYTMLARGAHEIGVLHGVDAQGNVLAEIGGTTYLLEPGHRWAQVSEKDTSPECHLVTTSRLRNYGLLDRSQVATGSDRYMEYLRRVGVTNAPQQLCWTDNGETLIMATRQGIRFYATSTLTQTKLWATSAPILGIAISPDDRTLASADVSGSIQLWDISSEQPVGEPMTEPPGPWLSLAFNPSGDTLASGSYDGIIQLWDTETGKAVGSPWADRMHTVTDLAFSPDGGLLLSSPGGNTMVRIWHVETGQPKRWDRACGPMALRADGAELACLKTDPAVGDPTLYIADLETRQALRRMADPPRVMLDLSFSPDGTMLATGSDEGRVQLWSAITGQVHGRWKLANGEWFDYVTSVAFSPDGSTLAACNRTGAYNWTIWLLDLETNQTAQLGEVW